jgi:hypothetical protein
MQKGTVKINKNTYFKWEKVLFLILHVHGCEDGHLATLELLEYSITACMRPPSPLTHAAPWHWKDHPLILILELGCKILSSGGGGETGWGEIISKSIAADFLPRSN